MKNGNKDMQGRGNRWTKGTAEPQQAAGEESHAAHCCTRERTATEVMGDETTGRPFLKEINTGLFLSFGDTSFKRQGCPNGKVTPEPGVYLQLKGVDVKFVTRMLF